MSRARDDMRCEYSREDLGRGVRGKYFRRYSKGTNLVLLTDEVARAFPTAAAVNAALLGVLALTKQTSRLTPHSRGRVTKRPAA